jgi:hypothetical protein
MLGRKNRMEAAEAPKLAFAWLGVRHPPKQALKVPRLWWVVFCYLVAEHDPAWNDGDEVSRCWTTYGSLDGFLRWNLWQRTWRRLGEPEGWVVVTRWSREGQEHRPPLWCKARRCLEGPRACPQMGVTGDPGERAGALISHTEQSLAMAGSGGRARASVSHVEQSSAMARASLPGGLGRGSKRRWSPHRQHSSGLAMVLPCRVARRYPKFWR